jgi:hypothetical protein
MAVAAIDFGNLAEGETEIGGALGVSSSINGGNSFAGAVGVKYGVDDQTAAIAKGWVGQNGNMAAAVGGTFRF